MKRSIVGMFMVAMAVVLCGSPVASASAMDDLSWFGNTGATAAPVKSEVYSGYWWWPTQPESNVDDSELWGNRGVVYNMYSPPSPPAPTPAPAPAPTPAPAVQRSVPIFNSILFDFDKSELKSEGAREVARVADSLKENSGDTVTVQGHTCDIGTDEYNQGLGQRRANTVAGALGDNGVASSRISAMSKGESSPAVPNTSEANREQNRRVVFIVDIK